jgi:hypothetical protein
MADTEVFHGPWFVRVERKDSVAAQRFVISGSDSSDGGYPGVPGESVSVTGDEWVLSMDWRTTGQFEPSRIRRSATYDVQNGLIITLGADDGPPATADEDFDDLIVVLQSEDPSLDPLRPGGNPYDFTIPEDIIIPGERDPNP